MIVTKKKYTALEDELIQVQKDNLRLTSLLANIHNKHQEEMREAREYQAKYQGLHERIHQALNEAPVLGTTYASTVVGDHSNDATSVDAYKRQGGVITNTDTERFNQSDTADTETWEDKALRDSINAGLASTGKFWDEEESSKTWHQINKQIEEGKK